LELDKNPIDRAAQLDWLERLVRGGRSWHARRVAARLLGGSDELRVVPALIFALSDPDQSVRTYARDGLRFISRNSKVWNAE
jgi:HEAT repeat protein